MGAHSYLSKRKSHVQIQQKKDKEEELVWSFFQHTYNFCSKAA